MVNKLLILQDYFVAKSFCFAELVDSAMGRGALADWIHRIASTPGRVTPRTRARCQHCLSPSARCAMPIWASSESHGGCSK